MKYTKLTIAALAVLCLTVFACSKETDYAEIARQRQQEVKDSLERAQADTTSDPLGPVEDDPEPEPSYVIPSDLYLVYAGSKARNPYRMSTDRAMEYMRYIDTAGVWHWFFDGYLMTEIHTQNSSSGHCFGEGYKSWDGYWMESANKTDWEKQITYYFGTKGSGVDCLDEAAAKVAAKLGDPPQKIAVFFFIPEPIKLQHSEDKSSSTTYWGELDGKTLDFSTIDDRVAACKWWIDNIVERFNAKNYKYLQLSGFYWFSEKISETTKVVRGTTAYCDSLGYASTWIPYFHASGYNSWKGYGFTFAYYQPNYFFYDVPETRVKNACNEAARYDMFMEMEFDSEVLAKYGEDSKADRLRSYMKGFEDAGAWAEQKMAYYAVGLHALGESIDPSDQALYREFCQWVVDRPCRNSN